MGHLGSAYQHGKGVETDELVALNYYKQSLLKSNAYLIDALEMSLNAVNVNPKTTLELIHRILVTREKKNIEELTRVLDEYFKK